MDDQVDRTSRIRPAPSRGRAPEPPRPGAKPPPGTAPPRTRRGWLRRALPLLVLLLILGLVGGAVWYFTKPNRQAAPQGRGRFNTDQPQPVREGTIVKGDLPVTLNALGTVAPLATVTVRTQVAGQLSEVAFQEGQLVKKGDFLVQIDPRPYQIALEQAQGQLTRDQALLKNAQLDLARYQRLNAQDSIARQQVDTQQALVQQYVGAIQTDQAAIDNVKLNLTYAHITAPIDGRVGLRQVDAGNYVTPGDANGLVVITQLQPITVLFTLPEDNLPAVMKRLAAGATLPVKAFDRSNTNQLASGTLTTVDNQIDQTTGTVKMRASFPNEDSALFPNQFVNARLTVDTLHDVPIVPASAVQRGAPGTYVYLVNPDNTVKVQPIQIGPSDGENIAVTSGLQGGEQVMIDGADRLKDGAKVMIPDAQTGGQPARAGGPQAQGQARQGQQQQPAQPGAQGGRRRQ
jgi:membrane fusion protein, multidrug efflux system